MSLSRAPRLAVLANNSSSSITSSAALTNSTAINPRQEAMMASAASFLYVLLLLPALARNQSYLPYLPWGAAAPATLPTLAAGYPAYGYPGVAGAYPSLPPVYAAPGSLSATPPFTGVAGSTASLGGGLPGFGFPAGWPARPLGPLAAALATAYPTLFAALTGPCRSWCRAPSLTALPLLFPPRFYCCL